MMSKELGSTGSMLFAAKLLCNKEPDSKKKPDSDATHDPALIIDLLAICLARKAKTRLTGMLRNVMWW